MCLLLWAGVCLYVRVSLPVCLSMRLCISAYQSRRWILLRHRRNESWSRLDSIHWLSARPRIIDSPWTTIASYKVDAFLLRCVVSVGRRTLRTNTVFNKRPSTAWATHRKGAYQTNMCHFSKDVWLMIERQFQSLLVTTESYGSSRENLFAYSVNTIDSSTFTTKISIRISHRRADDRWVTWSKTLLITIHEFRSTKHKADLRNSWSGFLKRISSGRLSRR